MSCKIIDGKLLAQAIRANIKTECDDLKRNGIIPGLAVVLIGDDPASKVYVRNKKIACEQVGIKSFEYLLSNNASMSEVLSLIESLNNNDDVSGILVQAPVPSHLDFSVITNAISPDKDVDCFHPYNVGKVMAGNPDLLPCTPAGIIELIKSTGESISGKNCVVIGRSNIVGKPVAMLLQAENGTVTVCHTKTKDLTFYTKNADILVVAMKKAKFIKADFVKPGAIVIDVGINRCDDGKLFGDVDFESVSQVAGYLTPVPGGVGPMTITMLLKNTIVAAEKLH